MSIPILNFARRWYDVMHPSDALYCYGYLASKKARLATDLIDVFGVDWADSEQLSELGWYKRAILKEMRQIDAVRSKLEQRIGGDEK